VAVIRLLLAYDGSDFHGWANQPGVRTVEGVLAAALGRLLGEPPRLSVAGRTDAGVHAWGQVASFAAPDGLDAGTVQRAANGMLAPELVVRRARLAPEGFDARHSATGRQYAYRLDTGPIPNPFTARFEWHRPGELSLGPMRRAARMLLGEHDFASFCRPPQRGGTVRRLERFPVTRSAHRLEIRAEANGFLHQMVRSLVGTLVAVGEGRLDPEDIPQVLASRHRSAAGPVAPPHGLTLERVRYGRLPRRARR
jgi:tRNA pseudouridine38-40 synthase